jgi:hypothetical protein
MLAGDTLLRRAAARVAVLVGVEIDSISLWPVFVGVRRIR